MNFTFTKEERLCSKKAFESLVTTGKTSFLYPYKATWAITDYPLTFPAQVAFAVPKRKFKRANRRNYIKRRLREAYRLNKAPLYDFLTEKNLRIQILIVYIATEEKTFHELEPKLKTLLGNIMADIQKTA